VEVRRHPVRLHPPRRLQLDAARSRPAGRLTASPLFTARAAPSRPTSRSCSPRSPSDGSIEAQTGSFIRKFVKVARRYRVIEIQARRQTITAADPFPDFLRKALEAISNISPGAH
jgi:hypothetical protein